VVQETKNPAPGNKSLKKEHPSLTVSLTHLSHVHCRVQERVPCVVDVELPHLGFLDPGADAPHLAAGTRLDLPYWMLDAMRGSK
jgi:hypothetical protein